MTCKRTHAHHVHTRTDTNVHTRARMHTHVYVQMHAHTCSVWRSTSWRSRRWAPQERGYYSSWDPSEQILFSSLFQAMKHFTLCNFQGNRNIPLSLPREMFLPLVKTVLCRCYRSRLRFFLLPVVGPPDLCTCSCSTGMGWGGGGLQELREHALSQQTAHLPCISLHPRLRRVGCCSRPLGPP